MTINVGTRYFCNTDMVFNNRCIPPPKLSHLTCEIKFMISVNIRRRGVNNRGLFYSMSIF